MSSSPPMGFTGRRCAVTAALVLAASVAVPGTASAHGIGGSAAGKSVWEFVPLGIEHMLLGWDHLLFIAGIVLLAGELRRAAKLISVFVAGHSTTLIIATMAGWQVNAMLVDVVIALSVLFVGVVGYFGGPRRWRSFGFVVLAFGLVHGLGLSTRLQALGLPEDGLLARVIAFNVGVEIGQLLAIVVMVLLGRLFTKLVAWPKAPRLAHGGLVVVGLVAAIVLGVLTVTQPEVSAQDDGFGSCDVVPRTETYRGGDGGHPSKDFYGPDETYPEADFGHVLGDGYLAVHYPPTLPAEQLTELRGFVTGPEGNRVMAGAKPGQTEQLKAINAFETMNCADFDLAALKKFTDRWFADPRSRTPEQ